MSNAKLEKKLCLAKDSPEPVFDLSECNLKRIPNVFAVIKVLRKECLYLHNNRLTTIKDGGNLCDLSLLKLLDLSSNKLAKLPPEIKYLKNLQVLRIDHNELTSLPDEIGSLSCLEQLSVSSNKLKSLPDTICNLSKLQLLDIRKNRLRSLPMTIYQNRCLQSLRLDEDCEWIRPPRAVVIEGTQAILSYFAQALLKISDLQIVTENNITDYQVARVQEQDLSPVSSTLEQLSLYDKLIEDNLRRLEKEKEEKLFQKMRSEKNVLDQKEKELVLHQRNQHEKQKLLLDVIAQQRKLDEKFSECQKLRSKEQNKFIAQLRTVENIADDVIKNLIEMNNAQKQKSVESLVSSLVDDIPVGVNLQSQKVLESMEKLLADEFSFSKKIEENELARRNVIDVYNTMEKELECKIEGLLSKRKNEHSGLLDGIKQDIDLQYAAVLMLIEKTDCRNIELHNQIAIIQNQLSKLTAIELQNRNLHMNEFVTEIAERRMALSELLVDIFGQQQAYRQQLIDQLRDVENRQSFKNKDEYWLIQYQRLLNSQSDYLARATCSVDPSLVFDLALFGVSHYAPVLSVLNCQSPSDYSHITDKALINVGVSSSEDRAAILKAIHHFVSAQRVLPTAPVLEECEGISTDVTPTAPSIHEIEEPTSSTSSNALINECVICMEKQSSIVFLPCGHLCCCLHCSGLVVVCPLCRCDVERKMQIFAA